MPKPKVVHGGSALRKPPILAGRKKGRLVEMEAGRADHRRSDDLCPSRGSGRRKTCSKRHPFGLEWLK